MATATLDEVDERLRAIISNLYMLIVQAHDYQGQGTQQAMSDEIKQLLQNLQSLSQTAKRLPTRLPLEIIQYVENSRNPDIYTREFVELVMRYNQQQKGRSDAYAQFRDILGREMASAIPDIREDVRKVVESSGGQISG
ncbi:mediator of RNA polymerase II transcription subunit 10 like protein [Zymoseptoria brevis]|uniref:Mediator of RNA polymerase II transcription subunit 10 n=1 Tax=Zymoseptoria brevis TaxID=1047168 RepID=A0A0F4GKQ7_9PEZI|nr:mediator of RNA polymerase II transcription subunit 10 like protein [Zymoseptoria brevis]